MERAMKFWKRDKESHLIVRDSLVTAFFCKQPYPKLAQKFGDIFEAWLARTPKGAKTFGQVGPDAEEDQPFSARLLTRARSEFDPHRAKKRDMCSVEISGGDELNPDYQFSFVGNRKLDDDETNVIELRWPASEATGDRIEQFVSMTREIAEALPFDSGYASLALMGLGWNEIDFARQVRKWAFRHPGFDMPANSFTAYVLGRRLRGAYWLTFVGATALKKLGGPASLRKKLPRAIGIEQVGTGVMLRAGQIPEVGDVDKGAHLPLIRSVAKVVAPVTLFGDEMLDSHFYDEKARPRWERRHLD